MPPVSLPLATGPRSSGADTCIFQVTGWTDEGAGTQGRSPSVLEFMAGQSVLCFPGEATKESSTHAPHCLSCLRNESQGTRGAADSYLAASPGEVTNRTMDHSCLQSLEPYRQEGSEMQEKWQLN